MDLTEEDRSFLAQLDEAPHLPASAEDSGMIEHAERLAEDGWLRRVASRGGPCCDYVLTGRAFSALGASPSEPGSFVA